jgi:nicotinamidase/pyrazinamidase
MKKALLLIDIQHDFLPGGALEVKEGDRIVPVANRLMKEDFNLILATKDWHPENHGSFADNHEDKHPGEQIILQGVNQILWPRHCVQNTSGAEFPETLNIKAIDKVFYKGTDPMVDSYSAFFDNGRKVSTGLHDFLKAEGIGELHVTGLAADYCVKFSVIDALELGYRVSLYKEGTRGVNLHPDDTEKAMAEMEDKGCLIK